MEHIRKIAVLLLITLFSFNVFADRVPLEQAKKVAKNFYLERINQYQPRGADEISIAEIFTIGKTDQPSYYVFNIDGGGYVIVTATDAVKPVLGYSLDGTYNLENQPENFKSWMGHYQEQIEFVIKNSLEPEPDIPVQWDYYLKDDPELFIRQKNFREVEPLILSGWDQGYPYNMYCPDPCPVGCVAVAIGQVMNYWRWPRTGEGSYTYKPPLYDTLSADFGATTYHWEEMVNDVTEPNPAVAELLFHIGVSVDMDYTPNGSGMWNHKAAYTMRNYFKYSPETEYVYRDSTNMDWDSLVVAHLDRAMPCYYAGWSDFVYQSGHAWVCDGYQGDYFHMNWGWGRSYDDYFTLDDLTPGGYFFNYVQELVINSYPDTVNYTYPSYCSGDSVLTSGFGSFEDGSGPVKDYLENSTCSWLISPQSIEDSVTDITLTFDRFYTDEDDLVSVYDGGDAGAPLVGTFSGNTLPDQIVSSGNELYITFDSDEAGAAPGWYASYTSTSPEWCASTTVVNEPADTISDGSGDFYYQNDVLCKWMIIPPDAENIMLNFLEFNTQEVYDFMEVYDIVNAELLGSYSGSEIPPSVYCPSGRMMLLFRTDGSITMDGWKVHFVTNVVDMAERGSFLLQTFPNPAGEHLSVRAITATKKEATLTLISLTGKEVYHGSWNLDSGMNQYDIDVSAYSKGIYVLRILIEEGLEVKKIIIE